MFSKIRFSHKHVLFLYYCISIKSPASLAVKLAPSSLEIQQVFAMEYSWVEYRPVKRQQNGDMWRVQTINRIRLFPSELGRKVKFNCEDDVGHWTYVWENPDGPPFMLIEFKSSQKKKERRRHCLVETGEKTFELLEPGHAIYKNDNLWDCQAVHLNRHPIVMQRLHVPTLKYMFQGDHSGAPAAVDLEEKAP